MLGLSAASLARGLPFRRRAMFEVLFINKKCVGSSLTLLASDG